MTEDYISYIRSRVGRDKIFLNFAGGILANEAGEILLQLRADKKIWGLPGGTMEFGESSVDTCRREFWEESGIRVEPVRLLNVYTNWEEVYPNGDVCQSVLHVYELVATEAYDVKDFHNEETLQLGFFSQSAIADLAISDKHRLVIEEYFSGNFALGH